MIHAAFPSPVGCAEWFMIAPDLIIVWRIYERCNLACQFCGYSRAIERSRRIADPETLVAFAEVLAAYQERSGRTVLVSWLGGEPLLWPELPKVARVFWQLGLRLGVTTNGVPLATPAVRESLRSNYAQLTVSIDGLAAFHDSVRDSPGLFEQIREHVCGLALHRELFLRVNTVLMRGNIGSFADFCAEMAAWGFQELTFNQLGGSDRPEFYPANRLLPEQVHQFRCELPEIRWQMAQRGLRVCGSESYLHRIATTARGDRIPVADCHPGAHFLFIDEMGLVSPCSFTSTLHGVPLAEIDTVEKLETLPARFAELRTARPAAPCNDCHSTQVFEKFGEYQPDLCKGWATSETM